MEGVEREVEHHLLELVAHRLNLRGRRIGVHRQLDAARLGLGRARRARGENRSTRCGPQELMRG